MVKDNGLPYNGMVNAVTNGCPRGANYLAFPNARLNKQTKGDVVYMPVNYHSFGKVKANKYGANWYPTCIIDSNYNPNTGGYSSAGAMGPYYATGLGNYPNSMYKEVYFGDKKPKSRRTVRRSPVRRSPVRRRTVRRSPVRRSPVKRRTVRRSPVRRSPVKRRTVRRSPVKRSPVRKSPARKSLKPPRGKFCEPKEKKFPVNTKARCSSALSYARYSKDPCKIARCVNKNCEKSVGRYSKLMKECGLRK